MIELLKDLKKDEEKKGKFKVIQGDIDRREFDKLDLALQSGFEIECGLKGCKLSGG